MFAILLVFVATAQAPPTASARVWSETAIVYDYPSAGASVVGELDRGAAIEIVRWIGADWVAIRPPRGSIDWIDASGLQVVRSGEAIVTDDTIVIRPGTGRDRRRLGAPSGMLTRGDRVVLANARPIVDRRGAAETTLYAIEPNDDALRFVHVEDLDIVPMRRGTQVNQTAAATGPPPARPPDAVGRLEASSRIVGGDRTWALLNERGTIVALVRVPLGLDIRRLQGRTVEIEGAGGFDEHEQLRVIEAREIRAAKTGTAMRVARLIPARPLDLKPQEPAAPVETAHRREH